MMCIIDVIITQVQSPLCTQSLCHDMIRHLIIPIQTDVYAVAQ